MIRGEAKTGQKGGRRWKQAGIAFAFALATALLLWNRGRESGWREASRPATPIPEMNVFNDPAEQAKKAADYLRQLNLLKARAADGGAAERVDVAREMVTLGQSAHFRNQGAGGNISLAAFAAAILLFHTAGDTSAEASAWADYAESATLIGDFKEAERALRTAVTLCEDGPETQKADIVYRFGEFMRIRGRYTEGRTLLDHALQIQQRYGSEPGQADCLAALGQTAFEEGSPALARELLDKAAALFARHGKIESRAAVLGQLGDVALHEGNTDEAERLYREGLAVWQSRNQDFWTGRFLARTARIALTRGDLIAAERDARESLRLITDSNGPAARRWPLAVLNEIALERSEKKRNSHPSH